MLVGPQKPNAQDIADMMMEIIDSGDAELRRRDGNVRRGVLSRFRRSDVADDVANLNRAVIQTGGRT